MPLAPTKAMLQFSDCSPADGMNAAFKFTGLRQAPLAALKYTPIAGVHVRGRSSYFAAREAGSGPSRRSRYFAYGGFRSKQTKEIWAAPASGGVALYLAAKRPLDRARKRSQPIRVTIAPPRTATHATPASKTQPIRTGAFVSPACCSSSRINLYPVERQWLVPKSCILVAARLQDGWDSSLVRLIRPTRHPQSHIRPGFGPEAWAKLIQMIKQ